ncbi:histidine kinase/DNA gyrase B/HSP90-like ATPase [Alkalibaculum bacchi]|uniref:histidine kinase n=1 Tax=Alkalibaculum bacchi TaxID=645887 RepID=A0A366I3K1_9FIRM|nr:HAMP domain-containing sensor histidine kinase [Alkalibaculum bacchi]RBP62098.1 histidine kinase/DNA gyrase B/HSP90-like ATPase [Alkalibaculum bacchi]
MGKKKVKSIIYLRVFSVFLATYLLLMISFSVYFISEERKAAATELQIDTFYFNNSLEEVFQEYLDEEKELINLSKVKNELLQETYLLNNMDYEVAIFTSDYKLIFNTNKYWQCQYTEYTDGNKYYTGYGYLNPEDWFSEEKIKEIEGYLYVEPQPKKIGDLAHYTVDLKGFWIDDDMIIPKKITVNPMYADGFDEEGYVSSSSGIHTDKVVYESNYENTRNLPYVESGGIVTHSRNNPNNEKRNELRQMVVEESNLKDAVDEYNDPENLSKRNLSQRIELLTYRYYLAMPYQTGVRIDDGQAISDFWTVVGRDINIGERCLPSLVFVWISCFFTFNIAAFILAKQTFKTYKQQEKLENHRKEMTNALAHDLKTPLSIIAGYAENLQANVHTEKREHYANHIQTNVTRMDQIIHNMLELTRLETDSLKVNFEDVALTDICETIIERYKPIWEEKEITVSLDGEAVIKADQSLMLRVIDNFFVNAIDNTPTGGKIIIRIVEDALEVYNSGSFIPENIIEEIWLPFKKGDAARSLSKGTGLGLAISGRILQIHGFSYGARNSERGVIFWFKFNNTSR